MRIGQEPKEAFPLSWPQGWPRTRIQDRKAQKPWKKSAREYREALALELERMGVVSMVLSTNVPLNMRGDLTAGIEPRDPGVAVYFSRKQKEDYSWQEVLGIHDPVPTESQVTAAYRERAQLMHPDRGGDPEMFAALAKARQQALDWVKGRMGPLDYVIACDQFKTVAWNINGIAQTIQAIRKIERCGATSLLEQVFKGFAQLTENAGVSAGAANTTA